jgi:hypothetical protein
MVVSERAGVGQDERKRTVVAGTPKVVVPLVPCLSDAMVV